MSVFSTIRFLFLAMLVFCVCLPVHALDVDLFERNDTSLTLQLSSIQSLHDRVLVEQFHAMPSLTRINENPKQFSVTLDSTPGILRYLKAARLSGGIYVHLPQLCPSSNCEGIHFKIRGKIIMFGDAIAHDSMLINGSDATHSAVFFTNEEKPRLQSAVYIGAEFSASAVNQINDSFFAIRQAYRRLAGYDLLAGRGILVTMARDSEGAKGFGGDFLNILRLTFHNRRDETEDEIVRLMVYTFAHEVAHALHPAKLLEMSPQGRVVSEGSADFLRVVILRHIGLLDKNQLTSIVSRAYDACQHKRGSAGLLERIAKKAAHFREYYDCGMIYYFAFMFDSMDSNTAAAEQGFISSLLSVFKSAPETNDDAQECALISDGCKRWVLKQMTGNEDMLKAQRAWFDEKWQAYIHRHEE